MLNPYLQLFDGIADDRTLTDRAARNVRDRRAAGDQRRRHRARRRTTR